jgi:hypothetical protein
MFVGNYNDVISFDDAELQEHLNALKSTLQSGEEHHYTNLEIVLFKTTEKLQRENAQLKKEKVRI